MSASDTTLAAEGRRLLEAATPGHLTVHVAEDDGAPLLCSPGDIWAVPDPNHEYANFSGDEERFRLFAFAVNNLPALLSALEERDALREQVQSAVEGAQPLWSGEVAALKTENAKLRSLLKEAGEERRDALIAAFEAGCRATHNAIQADPSLALDADPDFTEAAHDYAAAAKDAHP